MHQFTIYVDSREGNDYKFNQIPVNTKKKALKTGDYCVARDGDKMSKKSFDPHYAVERKSASDFLKSITWDRDRFEDELSRAGTFAARMPIMVERSLEFFQEEEYFQEISSESIMGTIDTHPEYYNVDYHFRDGRKAAQQLTYEFLNWRHIKLRERR